MPCTVPPAIWPSTTFGLIIGPQSSLTMYRRSVTCPVSTSTSQVQTCVALAQMNGRSARVARRWPRARPARPGGGPATGTRARRARATTPRRRGAADAGPAVGELDVVGARPRGGGPRCSTIRSRRIAGVSRPTAPAVIPPLRLPPVPAPNGGERGVALDRRHVVDVDAERVGGELHDGRLDAVSGRSTRHVDVDLTRTARCGSSPPRSPKYAAAGRGRLDVASTGPDTEVATLGARRRPARRRNAS